MMNSILMVGRTTGFSDQSFGTLVIGIYHSEGKVDPGSIQCLLWREVLRSKFLSQLYIKAIPKGLRIYLIDCSELLALRLNNCNKRHSFAANLDHSRLSLHV